MTVVTGLLGMGVALLLSRFDIHSLFDISIELAGLLGGGFAGAYTLGMFTPPGQLAGPGHRRGRQHHADHAGLVHEAGAPVLLPGHLHLPVASWWATRPVGCFPPPSSESLKGLTITTRGMNAGHDPLIVVFCRSASLFRISAYPLALRLGGPNISPGSGSVVANYRPGDWERTLRHGIKPNGRTAMIMPSEDYNRLIDDDLASLVAYVRQMPPARGGKGGAGAAAAADSPARHRTAHRRQPDARPGRCDGRLPRCPGLQGHVAQRQAAPMAAWSAR